MWLQARRGGSLSEELQAGCPAFFKQADKTYYEASELLARAGNASGSEQATLLSQAVSLMLQVPGPSMQQHWGSVSFDRPMLDI